MDTSARYEARNPARFQLFNPEIPSWVGSSWAPAGGISVSPGEELIGLVF